MASKDICLQFAQFPKKFFLLSKSKHLSLVLLLESFASYSSSCLQIDFGTFETQWLSVVREDGQSES